MTLQEFLSSSFYKSLVFDSHCYLALMQGGVDNWVGYCEAYQDYCDGFGTDSIDEIVDQEIRVTKAVYRND